MSSDGQTSEGDSTPQISRSTSTEEKQPVSSGTRTSEDTLVNNRLRKPRKEKKAARRAAPPTKTTNKISDQLAQLFADELAGGAKYVKSSDVLASFIAPRESTNTTSTTTTIRVVTTVVEKTQTTTKSTVGKHTSSTTRSSTMKAKYKISGSTYSLDDMAVITALEDLVERFGKVSHMGILDKSYTFFVNRSCRGDPLCKPDQFASILSEFAAYRKTFGWGIAFLGATSVFASYARCKKWPTMHFGVERVLNPLTNAVLLESGAGKRTISNSKALLKKNVSLGIYIPRHGSNPILQLQLSDIYKTWCADRNNKPIVQAYMTVMDPFAMPQLMVYIYSNDLETGLPNGLAALRKIVNGYHLDPCIALPGSPRGISELLILSAMALLNGSGVSYLSLGFEPFAELGEITGIPKVAQGLTRSVHKHAYRGLPIGGKQAFFDKFRPDDNQQGDLFLVIPTRGLPSLKHMKALMHTANIDISRLIFEEVKKSLSRRSTEDSEKTTKEGEAPEKV